MLIELSGQLTFPEFRYSTKPSGLASNGRSGWLKAGCAVIAKKRTVISRFIISVAFLLLLSTIVDQSRIDSSLLRTLSPVPLAVAAFFLSLLSPFFARTAKQVALEPIGCMLRNC